MTAQDAADAALPDFAVLERGRQAAPQVYERLRLRIMDLSLPPGAPLPRAELARRFGVSSTPVRDALMRLEEEGLVEVFPQHATVVSRIDVAAAHQAHILRRALETEIVRIAARQPDPGLGRALDQSVTRMRALFAIQDFAGFSSEDEAFHRRLFEAAGAPDLWALARSRSGHLDRLRRLHLPSPGKGEAILADHLAIARAVAEADPAGAEVAMRKHLAGTVANIDEIRARRPEFLRP
ncbi:transcriptional regulator [Alsobacter metallidurans]|uniref:Transcriptional regulator n=1 Tax=Alsobacter metallidurans TaxID=340221 RepID=A0A917I6M3_9HYPH|nr:GntR family transcriptional regulator [Alsobacter metallidurans]GGH19932.1 transcriptional regulator [Alsobacter metallidurans]